MARILAAILIALGCLALATLVACAPEDDRTSPIDDTHAGDERPPETCASVLTFDEEARTFSLESADCGVVLKDATVRIAWRTGADLAVADAAAFPERRVEETAEGFRWTLAGIADGPALAIDLIHNSPEGELVLRAGASAPAGASLAWLELPSAAGNGAGVLLSEPGTPLWLMSGHDIWIQTGVQELRRSDPSIPEANGTLFPCGNNGDWETVCSGSSFWYGAVAGPGRTPGLLWGALSANHWKTYAGARLADDGAVRLQVIQGTPGDERIAREGEPLPMEPIWLLLSPRPSYDLRRYAEASAAETPPRPRRAAPFGWSTWYYYFARINPEIVYDNCARLRAMYPAVEPLLCQIDDGYEMAFGDWNRYTRAFSEGVAPVAARLREMGLLPGLWMAPLLLDPDSETAAAHPDWLLRDAAGQPIYSNDGRHLLNVAVPAAAEHLRAIVAAKVADGFPYLKLDFLYGGAFEAPRGDGSTSMEAYHRAMALLREGAGEETFLLACGNPWLPSLGYFNASRDSGDIVTSFPGFPIFLVALTLYRAHAVRAAFDGVWWSNDPDNLVVRGPLTDTQARISLAMAWIAGSSNLLGDSLVRLEPARIDLLTSATSERLRGLGGTLWTVDLFDAPMAVQPGPGSGAVNLTNALSVPPSIWVRAVGDERYLALFAWRSRGDRFEFTDYDLAADYPAGAHVELIFGTDADLVRDPGGAWHAVLGGQDVAVYRIAPP